MAQPPPYILDREALSEEDAATIAEEAEQ